MPGRRTRAADHGSGSSANARPDQACRRGFAIRRRESGRQPVAGSRGQPEAGRFAGRVAERRGGRGLTLTLARGNRPRHQL